MMKIRKALQEDLSTINEIYNQAVQQRFCTAHLKQVGMEERQSWFTAHHPVHHPVFVAVDQRGVVGWLSMGPYREGREALAHVVEVSYYVAEKMRGKGVGSMLLDHAMQTAPAYGYTVLLAILLDKNLASRRMLEKFGFEVWGCMPGIARIDDQLADHLYYGLKL
jgi:L-amino acid N-acyltransferase YncA